MSEPYQPEIPPPVGPVPDQAPPEQTPVELPPPNIPQEMPPLRA